MLSPIHPDYISQREAVSIPPGASTETLNIGAPPQQKPLGFGNLNTHLCSDPGSLEYETGDLGGISHPLRPSFTARCGGPCP